MASVESDVESEIGIYSDEPDPEQENDLYLEEEIVDELHDEDTSRLLRVLGDGYDDTEPLRMDLRAAIDTE